MNKIIKQTKQDLIWNTLVPNDIVACYKIFANYTKIM